MVNNSIKVYARIKNGNKVKRVKLESYIISRSQDFDDLVFHHSSSAVRLSYYQFRYHKVFDQLSSQEEIFEIVAKPVVGSVIHGFNGTIFAYGQTGSGKTYSITGCPKTYENRGLIPRCIEHIFEYLNQNPEAFTIHLSYLEIYNEIGYDLLNPKQIASRLEEFPRVVLLEDGKGEAHLRNLSIHGVSTEKEAMRLLFLGDTNRTIAETPMNDYSSRSHCIFTIYLTNKLKSNNKTLRSKLHIVDLAGSERIGKSTITGSTLNEAKCINLSLHYLEQVISALSSSKKHIPFRNSMLTYLLKDSLCGNSLTTMLATLTFTKKNIEETISTCRFSKRVSMITTQPIINLVEADSQQEINILQNEIYELKTKLLKYEGCSESKSELFDPFNPKNGQKVDPEEKLEHYKYLLDDFLNFKLNAVDMTLSEMKYCMEAMRDICKNQYCTSYMLDLKSTDTESRSLTNQRKSGSSLNRHFQEIHNTSPLIKNTDFDSMENNSLNRNTEFNEKPTRKSASSSCSTDIYTSKIEEYHDKLKSTYEDAKAKAGIIEQCRQNIIILRTRMDQHRGAEIKEQLVSEIFHQQDIYRKTILELRTLEKKTNHLKFGLLQAEMKRQRSSRDHTLRQVHQADNIPVWGSNIDIFEPNDTSCRMNNSSLDSINSSKIYSDDWYRNENAGYSLDDHNRPEKENEGTQNISTNHGKGDCIPRNYPERKETKNPFFLEILTDDNCPLATDKLGPPLENQTCKNWYSEYQEQDDSIVSAVSKYCNINASQPFNRNSMSMVKCRNPAREEKENQESGPDVLPKKSHKAANSRQKEMFPETFEKNSKYLRYPEEYNNNQHLKGQTYIKKKSCLQSPERTVKNNIRYEVSDSAEFKEFIKSIPLTGDKEVDEEILNFYRTKFKN